MKKLFFLLIIFTIYSPININSQQVVSDPSMLSTTIANHTQSVAQFVEMIDRFKEQIQEIKKQIEEVKAIKEGINAVRTDISQTYNIITSPFAAIKQLADEINELPDAIKTAENEIKDTIGCLYDDLTIYEKGEAWVDSVYGVPKQVIKNPCGSGPTGYSRTKKIARIESSFYKQQMIKARANLEVIKDQKRQIKEIKENLENSTSQKETLIRTSELLAIVSEILLRMEENLESAQSESRKNLLLYKQKELEIIAQAEIDHKKYYEDAQLDPEKYDDDPKFFKSKLKDYIEELNDRIDNL